MASIKSVTGGVEVSDKEDDWCMLCGGTGLEERICSHCNGSGEGVTDKSKCLYCKGSGVQYVDCPQCNGSGLNNQ